MRRHDEIFADHEARKNCSRPVLGLTRRRSYLMGGRARHFGFYLYDLASATKGKAYDVGRSRKNLDKTIADVLNRVRQPRE